MFYKKNLVMIGLMLFGGVVPSFCHAAFSVTDHYSENSSLSFGENGFSGWGESDTVSCTSSIGMTGTGCYFGHFSAFSVTFDITGSQTIILSGNIKASDVGTVVGSFKDVGVLGSDDDITLWYKSDPDLGDPTNCSDSLCPNTSGDFNQSFTLTEGSYFIQMIAFGGNDFNFEANSDDASSFRLDVAFVPLPGALLLFINGLFGLYAMRRMNKRSMTNAA